MLFILLLQWARKDCTNMSWACSGKYSYTIFTVRVLYDLVTRITMIISKNSELKHRLNFGDFEIIIRFYECCLCLRMLWNLPQPRGQSEEIISVLWPNPARRIEFQQWYRFLSQGYFPWYKAQLLWWSCSSIFVLCELHVLYIELTWGTAPART